MKQNNFCESLYKKITFKLRVNGRIHEGNIVKTTDKRGELALQSDLFCAQAFTKDFQKVTN
jgi:hypothetical protein